MLQSFDILLVNRLPESDFVVVLERGGRLVEQGTYHELRSGNGYIHDLDISSHDDHDDQPSAKTKPGEESDKTDNKGAVEDEPTEVPSDRSVFMYYFKANGIHNMLTQILLIASAGVITSFRCKFSIQKVYTLLTFVRCLGYLVG